MATLGYILAALGGVLVGGLVRFWNSYTSEVGKNLATRQDLADLTKIAKEIEGKISHEFWNLQRRSELVRAVLLEVIETVAKAETALTCATVELMRLRQGEAPSEFKDSFSEGINLNLALDRLRVKIALIGGPTVIPRFITMKEAYMNAFLTLDMSAFDDEKAKTAISAYKDAVVAFIEAVRKDLDLPLELNDEALRFLSAQPSLKQAGITAN